MEMKGEQVVPAPQKTVWNALNDPEVLKACIPGCEELEKVSHAETKKIEDMSAAKEKEVLEIK